MDLQCMSRQFHGRYKNIHTRGRWSWWQKRMGRWISSKPDYFLAQEKDRRRLRRVAVRFPRHHDSDHRAIVAQIYGGVLKRMKRYWQQHHRFLIRLPQFGPRTEAESTFEGLKAAVEKPPTRKRLAKAWISPTTWMLVDTQAMLKRSGRLPQAWGRVLT
eukprot:993245-Ditylum_brightwellii.AAC.1